MGGAVLAGQEVELWAFDPVRTALRVPYPQALSGLRCLPSLRPSCASSNSLEGGLGSQGPSLTVANASSDSPGSGHKQLGEAAGLKMNGKQNPHQRHMYPKETEQQLWTYARPACC